MYLAKEQLEVYLLPIAQALGEYCKAKSEDNRLLLEIELTSALQFAFQAGLATATPQEKLQCKSDLPALPPQG